MKPILSLAAFVSLACVAPLGVAAQEVRDLTGHQPTSAELIDVLKPTGDAAGTEGGRRTRGIGAVPNAPAGKPQCKPYRAAAGGSRGIGAAAKPVSNAAALKVEFATNSAALTPAATQTLDELGKALSSDQLKGYCFVVEGHTDGVGSAAYNLKLSQRRAESVVNYLTGTHKIDPERLQAVGVGKTNPIASNDTDEGRQKNRRVQVANLGA
ncbi:OmpA family protein [Candidatus Binatia bacterium]|nr:OmpA family protein [Candidatus Binatia bacterium]